MSSGFLKALVRITFLSAVLDKSGASTFRRVLPAKRTRRKKPCLVVLLALHSSHERIHTFHSVSLVALARFRPNSVGSLAGGKDAKGVCQLAVPPDWGPLTDGSGAAVFHDPTTAIAVVTSQPGQVFKPFSEAQLKTLRIPKEKIFENTAKRLFYQDKTSRNSED